MKPNEDCAKFWGQNRRSERRRKKLPNYAQRALYILKLTNTRDMECYFYTVQA